MIYAVGDIHGHLEKLQLAHALIEADMAAHGVEKATTIHVGDLGDRGPATSQVIQYLIETHHPDHMKIQRLKKRKLKLKDNIAKLESRLIPDLDA